MFPLRHNFGSKYTREDRSLMVENYHKATIPKGLSHEFIIYRHRSLEKNTVRLERILGTDKANISPWPMDYIVHLRIIDF